jgi:hypothetical protein
MRTAVVDVGTIVSGDRRRPFVAGGAREVGALLPISSFLTNLFQISGCAAFDIPVPIAAIRRACSSTAL